MTSYKLILLGFMCTACNMTAQITGYDLNKPYKTITLSDTLREVSGITALDKQTIACVQDENGIIFIYDLEENKIKKQYVFAANGDYEGIANAEDTLYVLRSDGVLFETREGSKTISYQTGIPAKNNEGLCYDKSNHSLWIASKVKAGEGAESRNRRNVYMFDLRTKKQGILLFSFYIPGMKEFAKQNHILFATKTKKSGVTQEVFKFAPSAIAIHPLTKQLYLISSTDHLLFVFDAKGKPQQVTKLDLIVFNKPEGIIFLENGDLLITNEGQQKKPGLLWFRYSN